MPKLNQVFQMHPRKKLWQLHGLNKVIQIGSYVSVAGARKVSHLGVTGATGGLLRACSSAHMGSHVSVASAHMGSHVSAASAPMGSQVSIASAPMGSHVNVASAPMGSYVSVASAHIGS